MERARKQQFKEQIEELEVCCVPITEHMDLRIARAQIRCTITLAEASDTGGEFGKFLAHEMSKRFFGRYQDRYKFWEFRPSEKNVKRQYEALVNYAKREIADWKAQQKLQEQAREIELVKQREQLAKRQAEELALSQERQRVRKQMEAEERLRADKELREIQYRNRISSEFDSSVIELSDGGSIRIGFDGQYVTLTILCPTGAESEVKIQEVIKQYDGKLNRGYGMWEFRRGRFNIPTTYRMMVETFRNE